MARHLLDDVEKIKNNGLIITIKTPNCVNDVPVLVFGVAAYDLWFIKPRSIKFTLPTYLTLLILLI